MKVLITGGAGFVGSHLAEKLVREGHFVEVIDNLSTGRIENLGNLRESENFRFIEADVQDRALIEEASERCERIYHLAAAVGVKLIAERPVHTIETNIKGTENVLHGANKFGRRLFIASTSEVYGKNENIPFSEDDDIVLGSTRFSRWSYACSKAIDEFLGLAFHQQFGLEVVIGRLFNTIGPRQTGKYGMVVPRFVRAGLNNEPIQIYGHGKQSRCFSYVGDVIEGIAGLMDCDEAAGQVFNIGTTEEVTIEHLADTVIKLTGSKAGKQFVTYEQAYGKPIEDMMRRVPDTSRIKETIGWQPKMDLKQSLEKIIEYFRAES